MKYPKCAMSRIKSVICLPRSPLLFLSISGQSTHFSPSWPVRYISLKYGERMNGKTRSGHRCQSWPCLAVGLGASLVLS